MSDKPPAVDDQTIGLWRLDKLSLDGSPDESKFANSARAKLAAAPRAAPSISQTKPNHWGREVIGFDWQESDSVDNRWNQTEIGPFLASIVPLPGQKPVTKGLSIKVGDRGQGTVCYDTESLALRAAWTGGFLKFDPARYGLINSPRIDGELAFVSSSSTGLGCDIEFAIAAFRSSSAGGAVDRCRRHARARVAVARRCTTGRRSSRGRWRSSRTIPC